MSKLSGKIAVVTGGTGALGKFVTEAFLREGCEVIVTHTGNEQSITYIRETKKKYASVVGLKADVTSEKSVSDLFTAISTSQQRIDILCNLVGGVSAKENIENVSIDTWQNMMSLNLFSCFLMIKGVLPLMKKNGYGRIINIAALPAVTPEAKRGGYGVSKAGVIALTKTVAEEVREHGNLTINAIAPNSILTEKNKQGGTEKETISWVTPEQIVEMMIYLCSESGNAINGQILNMFGKGYNGIKR